MTNEKNPCNVKNSRNSYIESKLLQSAPLMFLLQCNLPFSEMKMRTLYKSSRHRPSFLKRKRNTDANMTRNSGWQIKTDADRRNIPIEKGREVSGMHSSNNAIHVNLMIHVIICW